MGTILNIFIIFVAVAVCATLINCYFLIKKQQEVIELGHKIIKKGEEIRELLEAKIIIQDKENKQLKKQLSDKILK